MEISLDQRGFEKFMVEVLPLLFFSPKEGTRWVFHQLDASFRKDFGIFPLVFPWFGLG